MMRQTNLETCNERQQMRWSRAALGFALIASLGILTARPSMAGEAEALEGNWLVTVTRIDPPPGVPPTFLSLMTFTSDGLVLEESNTNAIRSLGHGTWTQVDDTHFERRFFLFRFDANRNYAGYQKVTAQMEMDEKGGAFQASAVGRVFDVDGNLIMTLLSSENGKRLGGRTRARLEAE